jgi:hypothetical protein
MSLCLFYALDVIFMCAVCHHTHIIIDRNEFLRPSIKHRRSDALKQEGRCLKLNIDKYVNTNNANII